MTKKVFISYRSTQGLAVDGLISAIQGLGTYDIWYDQDLSYGQNWWNEIIAQIQSSDIVILALSEDYLDSEACKRERVYARQLGKSVIPIIIESTLEHKALPEDLQRTHILEYHAYERNKGGLQKALEQSKPQPLPSPLPKAPDAPIISNTKNVQTKHPKTNPNSQGISPNKMALIVAIIGLVGTIIAALIGILPDLLPDSSLTATDAPTQVSTNSATSMPTQVPSSGEFNLSFIFNGSDSFTMLANANSHLFGLVIGNEVGEEIPSDSFPALSAQSFVIEEGTCLHYVRTGTSSPRPRACNNDRTFILELLESDMFWYDVGGNQVQDIVVRQEDNVYLCSSASAQCTVSTSP